MTILLIQGILTTFTQTLGLICIGVLTLEILSGVFKAIKTKTLDSTKFREGLYGKIGYFIYIALAFLVAILLNQPLVLQATIIFVIGSEGVSILENLGQAGVPIPEFLIVILEKVKEKGNNGELPDNIQKDKENKGDGQQ